MRISAVSSVLNAAQSVAASRGFPAFSAGAATGENVARMLPYEKSLGRRSMKIMGLRAAIIAIAATGGFAGPDTVHAQSYPARSVTLIVPSAAGGGTDTIARLIGDQLSKQLGQGFVVENRTGGGMLVGTTAAAKAAPDGYTLLVGLTGNMSVNPSLFANLPYDPLADFTSVAMLANYPFLVVVNNDLPAKSIKELIALLKSQPGKIDYASAGNGTGQHLAPELFKMMTAPRWGTFLTGGRSPRIRTSSPAECRYSLTTCRQQ